MVAEVLPRRQEGRWMICWVETSCDRDDLEHLGKSAGRKGKEVVGWVAAIKNDAVLCRARKDHTDKREEEE